MKNKEIANLLDEIAEFIEMEEGVNFHSRAYRRAALVLSSLEDDLEAIYKKRGIEGLKQIPSIGEGIAQRIEEYLKTGRIKYYEELKKRTPIEIEELLRIEGMGPKRIKVLNQQLGIQNIKDLEKMAQAGKIRNLPGFGEKSEKNILEGIAFVRKSKGRFLLGEIWGLVEELEKMLAGLSEVRRVSVAGSVLRRKETIGDIDFLVSLRAKSSSQKIIEFFINLPGVIKVWSKGPTKVSLRLKGGVDVDLRIVPDESFGAALQYFTGSKEHNILTRKIAISKGFKLNEYGLFQGLERVAGKDEKEIYRALGMEWIPPELRENQGEIEAALGQRLPKLINYDDIKGDLQCHSNWNGGNNSIEELAQAAQEMGYEYLGISDHTQFLKIEKGLDEKQLAQQRREIDRINVEFQKAKVKFRVLQGAETNILNSGSLDIKDEALAKLDYVIAGIHSNMKMPKEKMTERIIRAMRNPYVDILAHPTGRILKRRDEYQVDFEKLLVAAKKFGTILEINSSPKRLDLNDQKIRLAKQAGVKMIINTDTHQKEQLKYMHFGVAQARRGWLERKDIINTQPLNKLLKYFK